MAGAAAESFSLFTPRAFSPLSASSPSAPFLCACSPPVASHHRAADSSLSTKPGHDLHLQQKLLLHQIALELDKEKDKRPFAPSVRVLFDSLKSVQDVDQVRSLLDGLYFPLPVFCSVIRKLGSSKLPRSAFSVYEWLHTREEKPDIFIYSSVLGVIQRCGEFGFVSRVMEHMKVNGVEPDLVAYKIIISAYEHMGLHQEAMAMLEELLGKGLSLDDMATFRILLEGSEKAMDIRGALRLYTLAAGAKNPEGADADEIGSQFKATVSGIAYRRIRSMLGSPQSSSCADIILELIDEVEEAITGLCLGDYQGIIWCCGRAAEDRMLAYRMLTRPKRYPVSASVCNHAMNILGKANKWEAALDVFERMLAHGPAPDRDSYLLARSQFNSLLSSSREARNSRWSLEILERMESQGIAPDQYAWDTSLITCAKRADLDGALLIFERMVEKGHVPSLISYGALLTSLEKCGFPEEAEQVWHHMKKLGIKPNIEAYTIMISVYSKASSDQDKLLLLLDEMTAAKVGFTLVTYNALITSCAKVGDGKGALKWMERLVEDGFQPNNISYDQVVKALSHAGEPERAREMCIEANRLKLILSESAYTALDSASKQ